jgi:hypothetical protein
MGLVEPRGSADKTGDAPPSADLGVTDVLSASSEFELTDVVPLGFPGSGLSKRMVAALAVGLFALLVLVLLGLRIWFFVSRRQGDDEGEHANEETRNGGGKEVREDFIMNAVLDDAGRTASPPLDESDSLSNLEMSSDSSPPARAVAPAPRQVLGMTPINSTRPSSAEGGRAADGWR